MALLLGLHGRGASVLGGLARASDGLPHGIGGIRDKSGGRGTN